MITVFLTEYSRIRLNCLYYLVYECFKYFVTNYSCFTENKTASAYEDM